MCGNIANLFVLQAIGRSNETSVRQALGASPARLVRQIVWEAGLLAVAGGAIAWWVTGLGLDLLRASQVFAPMLAVDVDIATFGYLWALCSVTACIVAGAAAVHLIGRAGAGSHTVSSRTVAGSPRASRLIDGFVGLQVALAIVLLVSAGMLVRMLVRVTSASAGVDAANVVTASLYLPPERYVSGAARLGFLRALEERLAANSGGAAVGFAEIAPTEQTPRRAVEVADSFSANAETGVPTASVVVSPGYFRAVGATIVEGRDVQWTDTATSAVVLVNQRFAEQHWPNSAPIGQRLRIGPTTPGGTASEWLTVVGVTSNIVQNDVTRQEFEPVVYVPYGRRPQPNMFAFVRSGAAIGASVTAIRESVFALDASLPLPSLAPLEARLNRAHAMERQAAATLGSFASLALLLAAVGVYAVIGQAVTRRTREIGIRLAVGATRRDIVNSVAADQLRFLAMGVGVGLGLSTAAMRFLTTHIAGVQAWDPLVMTLATGVLAVAAACGYWFPVRRALRIDPAIVLRQE